MTEKIIIGRTSVKRQLRGDQEVDSGTTLKESRKIGYEDANFIVLRTAAFGLLKMIIYGIEGIETLITSHPLKIQPLSKTFRDLFTTSGTRPRVAVALSGD
jgi:hypothetical protein